MADTPGRSGTLGAGISEKMNSGAGVSAVSGLRGSDAGRGFEANKLQQDGLRSYPFLRHICLLLMLEEYLRVGIEPSSAA